MNKATFLGTISLDFLKLPPGVEDWETYETEDIFATNFINFPKDYIFTLGSGIHNTYGNMFASLATTPAYSLPTASQYYAAGRDVIRWGGTADHTEIDFDRYIFTPIPGKNFASVSIAPKSEPHHLSTVPNLIEKIPGGWLEMVEAIKKGEFK
jgi:hypothetical protein